MRELTLSVKKAFHFDYPIIGVIVILMVLNILEFTPLMTENKQLDYCVYKTLNFLRYVCIFLFLVYYFVWKPHKKFLWIFIVFIISDYLFKKLANTHLLFELFFIPLCLSQFVRREKLYKILFISALLSLSAILIMYLVEILQPDTFFRGEQIRYTLGFSHPNSLGFISFYIAVLLILCRENFGLTSIFVLFGLALFNFTIPRSVTSAVLILFLLFSMLLIKIDGIRRILDQKNTILCFMVIGFFITIIIATYVVAFTEVGKEFLVNLPGSIWARFQLGKVAFDRYGLSLFGTPIVNIFPDPDNNIFEYFVVDCAYFYFPINYGLVFFISFLFLFVITIYRSIKLKEYKFLIVLISMMIYGTSEILIAVPIMMPVYSYIFCKSKD